MKFDKKTQKKLLLYKNCQWYFYNNNYYALEQEDKKDKVKKVIRIPVDIGNYFDINEDCPCKDCVSRIKSIAVKISFPFKIKKNIG